MPHGKEDIRIFRKEMIAVEFSMMYLWAWVQVNCIVDYWLTFNLQEDEGVDKAKGIQNSKGSWNRGADAYRPRGNSWSSNSL